MKKLTYKQRAILCNIGGFLLTTGGGFTASLSLFLIPVTTEYGFSQASYAAYMSLMSWFGIISHPIMGKVFAKQARHIRPITALAACYGFLCFFLLSRGAALYQFYIAGAMMSMLLPFAGSMLGVTVVSWWFKSGRSIAIALVAVGASFGTLFYAKTAGHFITKLGWRGGYISLGVLFLILTLIGAFLIAPPPEYLGMTPEGSENETAAAERAASEELLPLRVMAKSTPFRLLCLAAFTGVFSTMLIQQSIIPTLQADFGRTATTAATILSIYSIVCACFKPVFGIVYKKFGQVVAILYTGIVLIVASLLVSFTTGVPIAVAGVILLGVGNMFAMVMLPTITTDIFGARNYPVANGFIGIFFTIGAGTGPIVTGRIFDVTGSYRYSFLLIAILAVCTSALLLFAVKSKRPVNDAQD